MKKLLILVLLVAVVVSGMFAQATINGRVRSGVLTDFDGAPGLSMESQLIINWKIDDFTNAQWYFRARDFKAGALNLETAQDSWGIGLHRVFATTDLGKALGTEAMGLKWTSMMGFNRVGTADLTAGLSPFSVADVTELPLGDWNQPIMTQTFTIMDMVTPYFLLAPGNFAATTATARATGATDPDGGGPLAPHTHTLPAGPGDETDGWRAGVRGRFQQFQADVAFTQMRDGDPIDDPLLAPALRGPDKEVGRSIVSLGLRYDDTFGDLGIGVAANAAFDVAEDANKVAVTMSYGVAARATFQILTARVGFVGFGGADEDVAAVKELNSPFARVELDATVMPLPIVGFTVGTVINTDTDRWTVPAIVDKDLETVEAAALNDLDVALLFRPGRVEWRVGYLFLGVNHEDVTGGRYNSAIKHDQARIGREASGLEAGGLYFEVAVDF